jgi:recombination protein RecA
LLDIAALHNIVEKSGAWYSYKGERIGQGRENARAFLKENKDTLIKLDAEVRKQLGLTAPAAPTAVPAPAPSVPQTARVTTMPSAAAEPAKIPATRR